MKNPFEDECTFDEQIAEAREQKIYYLEILKADPSNEYLARKVCIYHSIVESLEILLLEAKADEERIAKYF